METDIRITDRKARVQLPKTFANSTIIIELVNNDELRIRKARVVPETDVPFLEQTIPALSDSERDAFLRALDQPPAAGDALRNAIAKSSRGNGPMTGLATSEDLPVINDLIRERLLKASAANPVSRTELKELLRQARPDLEKRYVNKYVSDALTWNLKKHLKQPVDVHNDGHDNFWAVEKRA